MASLTTSLQPDSSVLLSAPPCSQSTIKLTSENDCVTNPEDKITNESSTITSTCQGNRINHSLSNRCAQSGTGGTARRKCKHDRNGRKRSKSFSSMGGPMMGKIMKHHIMQPVLPTKFLLGGNITDPLNLNSLQNEEINRAMNAVTPKSSPIPTPPRRKGQIDVILPANMQDPLHLIDCADDAEFEQNQLYSPLKKCRKKRLYKKRRTASSSSDTAILPMDSASDLSSIVMAVPLDLVARVPGDCAKIPNEDPPTDNSPCDEPKNSNASHITECEITAAKPQIDVTCDAGSTVQQQTLKLNIQPQKEQISCDHDNETMSQYSMQKNVVTSNGFSAAFPTTKRKSEEHNHANHHAKKSKIVDKIVSPVVPQPGGWMPKRPKINHHYPQQHYRTATSGRAHQQMPQFKEKNKQYQYGNYNKYYGYRNANNDVDHRLRLFSHYRYIFEDKDILDIGCNIGHITLSIARDFGAKSVTGIDIDPKLIAVARKNVKHYVKSSESAHQSDYNQYTTDGPESSFMGEDYQFGQVEFGDVKPISSASYQSRPMISVSVGDDCNTKMEKSASEFFPISMPILYGSIDIPGFENVHDESGFPNNVHFKKCNYILEDDALLALDQPQFDVILCLSVTKWIHLNWGDAGIKQMFRRTYAQLRPGGRLILEPQNWASYKSKKKLTETIYNHYNSIEFFPDKFTEYLLSSVVGFAKSEILGYPPHRSKGFRRPIQIFTKSTMFPSERIEATPHNLHLQHDSGGNTESSQNCRTTSDRRTTSSPLSDEQPQQQDATVASEEYAKIIDSFCEFSSGGTTSVSIGGRSNDVPTSDLQPAILIKDDSNKCDNRTACETLAKDKT